MDFITAHVLKVERVFSGDYLFELPWFQRAYAWSDKHVGRLLSDLLEAMKGTRRRYFLGHVFLAKPPEEARSSIIDGHQRSISLTILFALLRDTLPGTPLSARMQRLIEAPGGVGFRLVPQPAVADFLATYVQAPGGTLVAPMGDIMDLSESERNILDNRDHLRSMLDELVDSPEERIALGEFLLENCCLIVQSVDDPEEAFALLTTEEETGLAHHSSERSKVSIISTIPRAEQEAAALLYERAQAAVGADAMTYLLAHIRTLEARRRTSKPVEKELLQRFNLRASGLDFLRQHLLKRAEEMALINRREVGEGEARQATARALTTLQWLDHQYWMPPALQWLAVMGAQHPETPTFFARLDRLAYMLKIGGVDPTDQELRFIRMLHEIDRKLPVERIETLQIERRLLDAAVENLRSRTFYAKRFHALVLRRIGWIMAPTRDPGPVDGNLITVEHVLPRKPPKDRQWWKDFPTADIIAENCNRLGNLAFLSLEENHVVSTSDYIYKRAVLAGAAARFVLAEHAALQTTWTPETIRSRTEALIAILLEPWQLSA